MKQNLAKVCADQLIAMNITRSLPSGRARGDPLMHKKILTRERERERESCFAFSLLSAIITRLRSEHITCHETV